MTIAQKFQDAILHQLASVTKNQEEQLHQAGQIMADTIEKGGIIQSFGSGHSYGNALEISGRAGGFIQTKVINEPSRGIYESVQGVGQIFMKQLDLRKEDTLILISNSGRNPLGVEMAMIAKEMGISLIVVTAFDVASHSTSRHTSGKMMHEFADVILDNHSIFGDACIAVEGLDVKVGGTSLYTGCMLLDWAVMEAIQILLDKGITPPLFKSANIDGGPAYNQSLLDQFKHRLTQF